LKNTISAPHRRTQTGSVLVTILVIAIIVVLFLLWQSGAFSSSDSAQPSNSETPAPVGENLTDPQYGKDAATLPRDGSPRVVDLQPQETPLEPLVQKPTGKEPEGITALANELIAAHPTDLSPCRAAATPIEALQCASDIQSNTLENVLADYEARRAAGDLVANERGGEALKIVFAELGAKLKPFEDAAK